jgi:succinoglycan biosynthesis transport protein ExoP
VKWLPNSMAAEQYRLAATRLALVQPKTGSAVVAVTSAIKGEGKTTTAINLGYTMARDLGKRVLLIDCDFKCPVLHMFGDDVPEWGLADYLTGNVDLEACFGGFGDVPCWVMPVGNSIVRSTELLKTDRLSALFQQLKDRFDYVVINTPPILSQATMNVLSAHADVLLLVVRANFTPHEIVKRAVNSLGINKPVHVILNAVRAQSLPSYMYEYAAPEASHR